jgi:hypothetical protein
MSVDLEALIKDVLARKATELNLIGVRRRPRRIGLLWRGAAVVATLLLALIIGVELGLLREQLRQPAAVPSTVPTAVGAASSPSTVEDVVRAEITRLRPRLAFVPWIPGTPLTGGLVASVHLQTDGTAGTPYVLIEYRRDAGGPVVVQVLEGPANCCLDSVRAGQAMNVQITPSVRGQYIPNEPQFGGPILWWDTPNPPAYLAITSTALDSAALVVFARSFLAAE